MSPSASKPFRHHDTAAAPDPLVPQNIPPRLLITAGPTHEPIDAVRFLGNRSSGRVGVSLAEAGARRGWPVTLLLGPATVRTDSPGVRVVRFRSTADLERLLAEHLPACDALIMAAAVSDYRPANYEEIASTKLTRDQNGLVLELEPTPDLLAGCSRTRRPDQVLVGFALEPRERLLTSARRKLEKKRVDLLVANPLETMDAETIEALLLAAGADEPVDRTDGPIPKPAFAEWLLDHIAALRARPAATASASARPAARTDPPSR